jgi:replicative DNA helicase
MDRGEDVTKPDTAKYEALALEIFRRILAEEDAEAMQSWLESAIARIDTTETLADFLLWLQTFDFYQLVTERRAEAMTKPESERKTFSWPWSSWSRLIEPLGPGMLAAITAPDGQGKTLYAECIAEHWARHGIKVVFVHYELNHEVMLDRRMARNTGLNVRQLRSGRLTAEQRATIAESNALLKSWPGGITYLHTPGWTMERTTAYLEKLLADGLCDGVVIDYLEKVAASSRQIKLFGPNQFQREADNVEQIKSFVERAGVPALMLAQMNKGGKRAGFDTVDRTGMRGAGEKSEFANLVVMLHRDRTADGYSNTVEVLVDKNTMGPTGTLRQYMQPEFFRVADVEE